MRLEDEYHIMDSATPRSWRSRLSMYEKAPLNDHFIPTFFKAEMIL